MRRFLAIFRGPGALSERFLALAPEQRLGIVRILYFGFLFYKIRFLHFSAYYDFQFRLRCANEMGLWYFWELPVEVLQGIEWALFLALIGACVGFLTQLSYWVALIGLAVVSMQSLKFCHMNHVYSPLVISFFFWGLFDRSSRFRLENLLRRGRSLPHADNWEIAWLVNCSRVFFTIVFFASALSKLRVGGIGWITTDSLQRIIRVQNFMQNVDQSGFRAAMNHWVIQFPLLCRFLAFDTVVLEILAPLALFWKRAERILIWRLASLHIGIYVLMYLDFLNWLALYLFWLPIHHSGVTFPLKFRIPWRRGKQKLSRS